MQAKGQHRRVVWWCALLAAGSPALAQHQPQGFPMLLAQAGPPESNTADVRPPSPKAEFAAPGTAAGAAPARTAQPLGPRPEAPVRARPSSERTDGAGSSLLWSTIRTALALSAVVGLVLGLAWLLRRWSGVDGRWLGARGSRAPAGILEILGRYPLGRGHTLLLLRMDRRVLLVAQSTGARLSAGGMTTLAEVTDPEEVASLLTKARDQHGESLSMRFQAMLRGANAFEDAPASSPGPAVAETRGSPAARALPKDIASPAPNRAPASSAPVYADVRQVNASRAAESARRAESPTSDARAPEMRLDPAAESVRRRLEAMRVRFAGVA